MVLIMYFKIKYITKNANVCSIKCVYIYVFDNV